MKTWINLRPSSWMALALTLTIPSFAFADSQGLCSEESLMLNQGECLTTGTGLGTAVTSGIYAVRKYSQATALEKSETVRVYSNNGSLFVPPIADVTNTAHSMGQGDKITIEYKLSPEENRKLYLG